MKKYLKGTRGVVQFLIPSYARGAALDIGAGTAKYKSFIARYVDSYVASDIEAAPNIDYVEDATALSFKDESFDTIFSFQTLEHVEKPDAMIGEIKRCLRVGGVSILTVPFLIAQHGHPYDFQRYTTYGLRTLFEKHGFKVVACDSYGGLFGVWSEMLKFLFIPPRKKEYSRVRRKIVTTLMDFLLFLDGMGLSKNEDFYPNSYIVAEKV